MRIIGCDLHTRQQTLAMLDTTTGEIVNTTLLHEGDGVLARAGRIRLSNLAHNRAISARPTLGIGASVAPLVRRLPGPNHALSFRPGAQAKSVR